MKNKLIGRTVTYRNGSSTNVTGEIVATTCEADTANLYFYILPEGEKTLDKIRYDYIVGLGSYENHSNTYEWFKLSDTKPPLNVCTIAFFTEGDQKNTIQLLIRMKDHMEDEEWVCCNLNNAKDMIDGATDEFEGWVPPESTLWRIIDDNIPVGELTSEETNRFEIMDL
jgi:hypothetical protein